MSALEIYDKRNKGLIEVWLTNEEQEQYDCAELTHLLLKDTAPKKCNHCTVVVRQVEELVQYTFTYPMMNDVMRIVKDMNPRIVNQTFDNTCSITLSIRKSEANQLRERLRKLSFE